MQRVAFVGVEAAKSGCYLCMTNTDLIDLGISIEGEGGLFLCVPCVIDAGRLCGMGSPEDMAALLVKLEEVGGLVAEHALEIERLQTVADGLEAALAAKATATRKKAHVPA
jgi:hypothetical protein